MNMAKSVNMPNTVLPYLLILATSGKENLGK